MKEDTASSGCYEEIICFFVICLEFVLYIGPLMSSVQLLQDSFYRNRVDVDTHMKQ